MYPIKAFGEKYPFLLHMHNFIIIKKYNLGKIYGHKWLDFLLFGEKALLLFN